MRKTGWNRGNTTHHGDQNASRRRVQSGLEVHQNIAAAPSHTTALLFFSCSLQENDRRRGPKVPLISPRASKPWSFVAPCSLAICRPGLPQIRVPSAIVALPKTPLHPHALPLRIVERRQRRLGGAALAGDLDLPAPRADERRIDDRIVDDIAHAEGAA